MRRPQVHLTLAGLDALAARLGAQPQDAGGDPTATTVKGKWKSLYMAVSNVTSKLRGMNERDNAGSQQRILGKLAEITRADAEEKIAAAKVEHAAAAAEREAKAAEREAERERKAAEREAARRPSAAEREAYLDSISAHSPELLESMRINMTTAEVHRYLPPQITFPLLMTLQRSPGVCPPAEILTAIYQLLRPSLLRPGSLEVSFTFARQLHYVAQSHTMGDFFCAMLQDCGFI